jgi:hypothetical protein
MHGGLLYSSIQSESHALECPRILWGFLGLLQYATKERCCRLNMVEKEWSFVLQAKMTQGKSLS